MHSYSPRAAGGVRMRFTTAGFGPVKIKVRAAIPWRADPQPTGHNRRMGVAQCAALSLLRPTPQPAMHAPLPVDHSFEVESLTQFFRASRALASLGVPRQPAMGGAQRFLTRERWRASRGNDSGSGCGSR